MASRNHDNATDTKEETPYERDIVEDSEDEGLVVEDLQKLCTIEPVHQDAQIPIIDLAGLDDYRRALVIQEIKRACEDWGIFEIVNHGVPQALLEKILQIGKELLTSSSNETIPALSDSSAGKRSGSGRLPTKPIETLRFEFLPLVDAYTREWPARFEATLQAYHEEMSGLAQRLLAAISESLGLYGEYLNDAFGDGGQWLDYVRYLPAAAGECETQSNAGCLTLLLQNQFHGLQVLHKDGHWISVDALANSLVIKLTYFLEILSNGQYKSAKCRTHAREEAGGVSVVLHRNASPDAIIFPAPELTNNENPPLYSEFVLSDYLSRVGCSLHPSSSITS